MIQQLSDTASISGIVYVLSAKASLISIIVQFAQLTNQE